MRLIPISEELRNYIQRLNFEEIRYLDLLQTVNRDSCPMTDEEWESSRAYYLELYQEASLSKKFALEEIASIYQNEIQGEPWHIDFDDCAIVVGTFKPKPKKRGEEEYTDFLARLFPPEEGLQEMKINSHHVKDITLQVTDACNMACTYCYQHSKKHNSMSFETAKRFIDMILDSDERINTYLDSNNTIGAIISFIGGEPWLEIDLISQVSDYILGELFRRKHPWAIKFCISICSNGLLHFDKRVQEYLERHKYHMSYSISIDGNKELHDSCRVDLCGQGTYERAIAGVRDFREKFDGYIGSKMTIAPENVDKVYEAVVHMVENEGYDFIHLNCVYEEGWTNEHANILYWELHKLADWLVENNLQDSVTLSILDGSCGSPQASSDNQNYCGGLGLMIAMDYKGDIFPCLRYMETSASKEVPPYIIGNLDSGVNVLKEHKERVSCMECITRRSQSTDECFNCPIGTGCGWCSAYNYEHFKTQNKRATYICCMHKARVLANVYYHRLKGESFPNNCPKEWAIPIIGEEEYEKINSMKVV